MQDLKSSIKTSQVPLVAAEARTQCNTRNETHKALEIGDTELNICTAVCFKRNAADVNAVCSLLCVQFMM